LPEKGIRQKKKAPKGEGDFDAMGEKRRMKEREEEGVELDIFEGKNLGKDE